jgi:hypothetical protein
MGFVAFPRLFSRVLAFFYGRKRSVGETSMPFQSSLGVELAEQCPPSA